ALLTLFASIALVMVIYAQGAAERARITKDAMSAAANDFPDDGTATAQKFLSQLIFDSPDAGTSNGLSSSLRGHSLMATMYGRQGYNTIPWNGFGPFAQQTSVPDATDPTGFLNRRKLVNFRMFQNNLVFDPEFAVERTNPNQAPNTPSSYIPKNAPY